MTLIIVISLGCSGYRSGKYAGIHGGDDIGVNGKNVPILASASGTVVQVQKDGAENIHSTYGNCVIIKLDSTFDGNTYFTLYAHMKSIPNINGTALKVGDHIAQGQQIGLTGGTGQVSGIHLHFELYKGTFDKAKRWSTGSVIMEPLRYIQMDTVPEIALNRGLPDSSYGCNDKTITNINQIGSLASSGSTSSGGDSGSSTSGSGNSTASGSNTGTSYSGGKWVFSQEITSALKSASYNDSTFNRSLNKESDGNKYYYQTTKLSYSGVAYSARNKPSWEKIPDVLATMSDWELLARTIMSEAGSNSEEAGVLAGLTILSNARSRGSIAAALSVTYVGEKTGNKHYSYNAVEGDNFWKAVPTIYKELALKACAARQKGEYMINNENWVDVMTLLSNKNIGSLTLNWSDGSKYNRMIILRNNVANNYSAFFVK